MQWIIVTTLILLTCNTLLFASKKQDVRALYIPLADHYAVLVAYEKYGSQMKYANFSIKQMKNWDLLRAYFQSGKVDMAYITSPLAMDMFAQKPNFRWIGLVHRDGSALAVNDLLNKDVQVASSRKDRKPTGLSAKAFIKAYTENKLPTQVGLPHLLSTHAVVLYRYLHENGSSISFTPNIEADVLGISLAPSKSPAFIKIKSKRATPAAFEQSLPWADVVETGGYGKVAWYSKDVMNYPNGHVECLAVATDSAIASKQKAIKEVMYYIQKAGADIEEAIEHGAKQMDDIVAIVQKHIKAHTSESIKASLSKELHVINYTHLNVDKKGLALIMHYALEGNILKKAIDIDKFADEQFNVKAYNE